MKQCKWWIPVLVLIAAFVWSWNLWTFVLQSVAVQPGSALIPEIPEPLTLDLLFNHDLPELTRDPFRLDQRPPTIQPKKPVPVPKVGPKPPSGVLRLITADGEKARALFEMPGGEIKVVAIGDQLADWTVKTITLEQVIFRHETGELLARSLEKSGDIP